MQAAAYLGEAFAMKALSNLSVRDLNETDREAYSSLVLDVFDEFVAPHWSPEGIETFHQTSPEEAKERFSDELFIRLGAESNGELVGVLMMSLSGHLYAIFVAGHAQRSGVGRRLLKEGLTRMLRANPSVSEITSNAAPNSVQAHESFGFETMGPEIETSGIRVMRMRAAISALRLE